MTENELRLSIAKELTVAAFQKAFPFNGSEDLGKRVGEMYQSIYKAVDNANK